MADLNAALAAGDATAAPYTQREDAYLAIGDFESAAVDDDTAVEKDPTYGDNVIRLYLARLRRRDSMKQLAQADLEAKRPLFDEKDRPFPAIEYLLGRRSADKMISQATSNERNARLAAGEAAIIDKQRTAAETFLHAVVQN